MILEPSWHEDVYEDPFSHKRFIVIEKQGYFELNAHSEIPNDLWHWLMKRRITMTSSGPPRYIPRFRIPLRHEKELFDVIQEWIEELYTHTARS